MSEKPRAREDDAWARPRKPQEAAFNEGKPDGGQRGNGSPFREPRGPQPLMLQNEEACPQAKPHFRNKVKRSSADTNILGTAARETPCDAFRNTRRQPEPEGNGKVAGAP